MTPFAKMWRRCWNSRGRPNRRDSEITNWNRYGCALCLTFQKPLGAVSFSRYNGGRNGGAANDENRGHQGIFQEGSFARRHRRAAVLHFQIRLHQEWRAGSSLALDTLRPALRHPSDVRLDRAGRRLPGRRRRAVRAELHHRRPHRGLRPGVAPAGGGMVCAPHHLSPDRGITVLWKCGKRPLHRWISRWLSHSSASMAVYAPPATANILPILSYPILIEREKRGQKRSGSVTLGSNRRWRSRCDLKIFTQLSGS